MKLTSHCSVSLSALHLTNFTIGEKTTIVWTPKGPDDNAALVFLLGNPKSGFEIYQGFPDGPWGRVSAALGSLEVTLDPKLKAGGNYIIRACEPEHPFIRDYVREATGIFELVKKE